MKKLLIFFLLVSCVLSAQPLQMGASRQFIPNDYVWNDLRTPLLTTNAAGSNPPGLAKMLATGTSQGIFVYAFDRNVEEEVYSSIQIPHNIRKTYLYPHIHWAPSDNGVGTVSWGIEWIYVNYNTIGSPATEIYRASQNTSATANLHHIIDFPRIEISKIKDSSVIFIRLFRDATNASDSYAADAYGFDFDLHYQSNSLGSSLEVGDN